MAQILLHGTLHATIFEVDKLKNIGGGNILSKVLIFFLTFFFYYLFQLLANCFFT